MAKKYIFPDNYINLKIPPGVLMGVLELSDDEISSIFTIDRIST